MMWNTSCPDWERRLLSGESLVPFPPLYPEEAEQGLSVMRELQIVDAPGSPTMGAACAGWVFDFAGSIFGAYDPESGRRRITEWFLMIPKKNSKSTIAAAVMLTALLRNWRKSAEFIILSPTIEIADNSFKPATDMIRVNEELSDLLRVQDHVRTITHRTTGATLKVVAADTHVIGGKKAVGILIDEAWIFGKKANAENMLREATGGLASRPEGFVIWLTTQSDEPPSGVFRQKLQYARDVRDGVVDDNRFLPVLYEFPQVMVDRSEHRRPENFGLVNPNLGYSVDREFMDREFKKAENDGEESMRGFLAKHLNVEIGLALRSDRWAGADYWIQRHDAKVTLDYLLSESEIVDVGIDGGGLDDLLGLAVIGRHRHTKKKMVWAHAWAHPSVLERRKQEASRFRDFERDGDLTIVDCVGLDVEEAAGIVREIHDCKLLDKVGVDQAGLGGVLDALENTGIAKDDIVGVPQGWRLSGTIKTVERWLAGEELLHGGQPLMAWCVSNARTVPAGNAVNITKQVSGSAKIDPLMALFDAAYLMERNPAAARASVYETRGVRFI